MGENYNWPLSIPFLSLIDTINEIKFSPREVDILACILGGRTTKKTASLLSLSPKTVENYIRNITLKLECNSREAIIDFVERSDKLFILKDHYLNLLIQAEFDKILKEISPLRDVKTFDCILKYGKDCNFNLSLIPILEKHLKFVGLNVTLEAQKGIALFSEGILELRVEKESMNQTDSSAKMLFFLFLLERNESEDIHQHSPKFSNVEILREKNYYYLFFNLLKMLYPQLDMERQILYFKEKYENMIRSHKNLPSRVPSNEQKQESIAPYKMRIFLKKRKWLILSAALIGGLFSIGIFILTGSSPSKLISSQARIKQETHTIRSDLPLPAEDVFLDRPELIAQIEEKLKGQGNIQAVALVGVGGAGKTTLARYYAHSQSAPVIWEINAETKESLKESFEDLAYALAATEEDRKIFREIQETKNPEKKEDQIISFVKERLYIHSNWFLIYDNVEKFADIKSYFPQDPQTWGEGKIILTTRNGNIQNNKHILGIIQVGELSPDQKLALFNKIMGQKNIDSFSSLQIKETRAFLKKLSAFPLDISIAAYYLRATNNSYTSYLTALSQNNKDFANMQEELLNEAGDYIHSRYNIITLSLQNIINSHKDFGDLLLFISLLDSQNIPQELLEKYKEKTVVDSFIYNLKKYSLITNDSAFLSPGAPFSIHRSTREISLAYLLNKLNLEENIQVLQPIVDILVNYMTELIDKEDVSRMKSWISHGEAFLSHNKLLNGAMHESIRNELGRIYCDLAYFIKAKSLFEENIIKSNKKYNNPYTARALTELGGVYKNLGDYKKAKDLLQKSVLIYKNHLPENHKDKAYALLHLGFVYAHVGDYEEAKDLLEESLIIYKDHFPEKYAYGVRNFASLGNIYRALGNYEEARNLLEQSLTLCRKYLPQDHMELALTVAYLGVVNEEIGHDEEAKNLLEQCLVICKKHFSENHLTIAQAAMLLGNAYIAVGQHAKAKDFLEQSLKIFQQYYPEKHIFNVRALISLGRAYTKLNDYEKAKSLLEKSLEIYVNNFDEKNIETAKILGALGQVYFLEDQLDDAENLFMRALVIFQKNDHPNVYMAFEDLAHLILKKSKDEEAKGHLSQSQVFKGKALAYLKQAEETVEKYFPRDSPHVTRIQSKIKSISR